MNNNQDNAAFEKEREAFFKSEKWLGFVDKIHQEHEDKKRAEAEKAAQEKQQADEEAAMVAMAEHLLQHINSVLSNS